MLARTTPGCLAAATFGFAMSQVLFLTALILPWKILLFLSSGHFPTTLPHFLASYKPRELVVMLSTAALLAFLAHVLLDIAFGWLARRGADQILERHRKIALFNNQRRIAVGFYRHMLRIVACLASCGMVLLALALIYPLMFFALGACLVVGLAAIAIWQRVPLETEHHPSPASLGRFWLGGGFLFLVGWIVADYWMGHLPHLTIALICLLLARQALIFAAQFAQSLYALGGKQRSRVDALFLADAPWLPATPALDDFQALFTLYRRDDWIRDMLALGGERNPMISNVSSRTAEAGRLVYLIVSPPDGGRAFLIKLFHHSLDALARHEIEILAAAKDRWPAPLLRGHYRVERHHCLVFEWDRASRWLDRQQRATQLPRLRSQLIDCSLPRELADRYDRSQPNLVRRLSNVDWDALRAFSPNEEMRSRCALVEAHWDALLAQVGASPRQIVLPGLMGRMMAGGEDGRMPILCNWSRWRWEPAGAGWPITAEGRKALRSAFSAYRGPRREFVGINEEAVYRVSLLHEMERQFSKRGLTAALTAVSLLHDSLLERGMAGCAATPIVRRNSATARASRENLPC